MTPAYDPKFVSVSALAVACFSVGFSVTAAAYLGANTARLEPTHARVTNDTERDATAAERARHDALRGCRLAE